MINEEMNRKVIALAIKGGGKSMKFTKDMLVKAIKAFLNSRNQLQHGKQSLKQLSKHNAGLSTVEVNDQNVGSFKSVAKKYHVDFSIKKDASEVPPKYIVFFKGRDIDAITQAFKEFTAKQVKAVEKPSLIAQLKLLIQKSKALNTDKVKHKDRGHEL